jgi:hypothetical protein
MVFVHWFFWFLLFIFIYGITKPKNGLIILCKKNYAGDRGCIGKECSRTPEESKSSLSTISALPHGIINTMEAVGIEPTWRRVKGSPVTMTKPPYTKNPCRSQARNGVTSMGHFVNDRERNTVAKLSAFPIFLPRPSYRHAHLTQCMAAA